MKDWQVRLMLEAQAAIVRSEGMKAENAQRAMQGDSPAYGEGHFIEQAEEIERLAREIGQG